MEDRARSRPPVIIPGPLTNFTKTHLKTRHQVLLLLFLLLCNCSGAPGNVVFNLFTGHATAMTLNVNSLFRSKLGHHLESALAILTHLTPHYTLRLLHPNIYYSYPLQAFQNTIKTSDTSVHSIHSRHYRSHIVASQNSFQKPFLFSPATLHNLSSISPSTYNLTLRLIFSVFTFWHNFSRDAFHL